MRLTKRYIIKSLDGLPLSSSIRYERYYISDNLRIQKKADKLEKETLDAENVIIKKEIISEDEFQSLKKESYASIIRDSYLYLNDERISIKKYLHQYEGFIRVEVSFTTKEEMNSYQKEEWMGKDITESPLAFDKYLSKLSPEEFQSELNASLES